MAHITILVSIYDYVHVDLVEFYRVLHKYTYLTYGRSHNSYFAIRFGFFGTKVVTYNFFIRLNPSRHPILWIRE